MTITTHLPRSRREEQPQASTLGVYRGRTSAGCTRNCTSCAARLATEMLPRNRRRSGRTPGTLNRSPGARVDHREHDSTPTPSTQDLDKWRCVPHTCSPQRTSGLLPPHVAGPFGIPRPRARSRHGHPCGSTSPTSAVATCSDDRGEEGQPDSRASIIAATGSLMHQHHRTQGARPIKGPSGTTPRSGPKKGRDSVEIGSASSGTRVHRDTGHPGRGAGSRPPPDRLPRTAKLAIPSRNRPLDPDYELPLDSRVTRKYPGAR